jgi:hypothetical protein
MKWEYRIITFATEADLRLLSEKNLNKYGAQGWGGSGRLACSF